MKKIFLICIILVPFTVFGNEGYIYYCSDTKFIGFEGSTNKVSSYIPQRFKILINFERKYIKSKDLWFEKNDLSNCFKQTHRKSGSNYLICSNEWGNTFVINQNTLNFKLSYLPPNPIDSIGLSYGKCEKF